MTSCALAVTAVAASHNHSMLTRRGWMSLSLAGLLPARELLAQQRRSLKDPLRLGVDNALMDSGLAPALQRSFGRDTGVAVLLVRMPSLPLLEALDRGELDAALANAPESESRLESQGLVYDRLSVAVGQFVIVGPQPHGKTLDPAGLAGGRGAAEAMVKLRNAAVSGPGSVRFLSAADGSGTHLAEQALWRAAKIAPQAPWYGSARTDTSLVQQARSSGAYAIVERGVWLAQGGAPLSVLVSEDPALVESVHVMRAFRVNHPAAKIFVAWIAGARGRRTVAAQPGYRDAPR